MKRLLQALLCVSILLAAGCAAFAAAKPEYVIKVGYILPETQSDHIVMRDVFKKDIEEKSGGRIAVELYPNAQLGGDRELIESVQLGTIQVAIPATAPWPALTSASRCLTCLSCSSPRKWPSGPSTGSSARRGRTSQAPGHEKPRLRRKRYRHISNSRKPIYKPEDLKGLKIRTMEIPLHVSFFKMLGANPTPMSFGELYTALQQKTVDGQENPVVLVYTSKFYEVQKYYSLTGHLYSATILVANDDFFAKMPEDLWKIVEDAGKRYVVERRYGQRAGKVFLEDLKKAGMEVNELTPEQKRLFIDATLPVYDEYKDIIGLTWSNWPKANLD